MYVHIRVEENFLCGRFVFSDCERARTTTARRQNGSAQYIIWKRYELSIEFAVCSHENFAFPNRSMRKSSSICLFCVFNDVFFFIRCAQRMRKENSFQLKKYLLIPDLMIIIWKEFNCATTFNNDFKKILNVEIGF